MILFSNPHCLFVFYERLLFHCKVFLIYFTVRHDILNIGGMRKLKKLNSSQVVMLSLLK